jgi:hypothetical protein
LAVRSLAPSVGVCLVVAFVAGCGGSSSHLPPGGGVIAGGWQVISQDGATAGLTVAKVSATATDPARLQLRVNSSPNVTTSTSYQVQCGDKTAYGHGASGHTPLTREMTVPTGGGSQEAHGIYCFVLASATKPADAHMTVTLVERPAPTKT